MPELGRGKIWINVFPDTTDGRSQLLNGLHTRGVPVATGTKLAKPNLVVFAGSGDGCIYSEGGGKHDPQNFDSWFCRESAERLLQ
jgi:thiamine pyrophosphate-dependent acetolactate synthase large subunit-like protein